MRATLLHDPTVEGLDVAIYMDGSKSMSDEYEPSETVVYKSFFDRIFGSGEIVTGPNQVSPQVIRMLEYLATKDRNGLLRMAYWACGNMGDEVEVLGEIRGADAKRYDFKGPRAFGSRTNLAPAIRDFVAYLREQQKTGARQGCAVFVTDGELHDAAEVKRLSADIAAKIARGHLPRMNFILVGVGSAVNEEQLEQICHEEYPGIGHLWCHRIAEEIHNLAELVAVLVDESMTVAAGGTVYDDQGDVVKVYEARLPAVLEFEIRDGARFFTLEVNGQRYKQPLPDEDDEDEDHH